MTAPRAPAVATAVTTTVAVPAFAVYEVGGSVRDGLIGVPNKDEDFVVVVDGMEDATVEDGYAAMRAHLVASGFEVFTETPEFVTLRAHFPKGHPERGRTTADFVMARREGAYTDGRHPDHVSPGTLADDLARRDFTVNAMARGEDGVLVDPHGGAADLEARVLRAVGSAEQRMREDPLRVLRAMRFAVTRGFTVETGLDEAMRAPWVADALSKVSEERRTDELGKMFRHDTVAAVETVASYGLTRALFSGRTWLRPTLERR